MVTVSQSKEKDFINNFTKKHLEDILVEAISWIQNNLSPEEVFSEEQLADWAIDNDKAMQDLLRIRALDD